MADEVLIKITLDEGDNEKKVDELTKSITELSKANKELLERNKELAKSGQQNTQEYLENTRQIEINKQKISEATASRKGLVQQLIAETDSIKDLKARNAELIKQRDQISTKTKEGRNAIILINKEIDKNNQAITDNSSALEKQRFNIGNYKSALDGLVPGLSGFIEGIQGATRASLAFIATPIGAILAAVALALSTVISYFKGSEEGMDTFAKASAQVSAVLDVLMDRLILVGKGLFLIASGKFSEGIDTLTHSFDGLGDEIEREVQLAGELADALDALEERELKQSLRLSEQANQVKLLMIAAKNRSLSEEERAAKLQEALELEKQLNQENLDIQLDRIDATAKQLQADFSQFEAEKQIGESTLDFAKRLIANEGILLDERQKLADELIKYNGVNDQSITIQEKIINQNDTLINQANERTQKQRELNAEVDAYIQKVLASIEADSLKAQAEAAQQEQRTQMADDFLTQTGVNAEKTLNFEQAATDRRVKNDKQESDSKIKSTNLKKKLDDEELANKQRTLNAGVGLLQDAFAESQEAAIAGATISTYRAAAAALEPAPVGAGPLFGPILAALTVIRGLLQVSQIAGVQFAKGGALLVNKLFDIGGITKTGGVLRGRSHAFGGIPFTLGGVPGFEAEGNEIILTKGVYENPVLRKAASDLNVAGGGVPFQWGGMLTTTPIPPAMSSPMPNVFVREVAAKSIMDQRQIRGIVMEVIRNLPPTIVSVVDINERVFEYNSNVQKATII